MQKKETEETVSSYLLSSDALWRKELLAELINFKFILKKIPELVEELICQIEKNCPVEKLTLSKAEQNWQIGNYG